MAKTMFSRYPNTDRAAPEYLVELINCLAEQPQWIIDRVADRRLGITAKHPTFLPSVNQVLEMILALREDEAKSQAATRRRAEYRTIPMGEYRRPAGRFQPFPKLWEAFADEPATLDRLNTGLPFETIFDASRALATQGVDTARKMIWRGEEQAV